MDTKTLHNWAVEARLDFDNDESDAIEVWTDAIMSDRGWLIDLLFDGLATATDPKNPSEHDRNACERFFRQVGDCHDDLQKIGQRAYRASDSLLSTVATSYAYKCQEIGEFVFLAVRKEVIRIVEQEAATWWGDVCAYEYDMKCGQEEDYYDGLREERLLASRLDD